MDSGLQVFERPEASLPEHHISDVQKEVHQEAQSAQLLPDQDPLVRNYRGNVQHKARQQRVCGMAPWLFGILVAAGTAIIVGAAIGGGLGSSLKDARRRAQQW